MTLAHRVRGPQLLIIAGVLAFVATLGASLSVGGRVNAATGASAPPAFSTTQVVTRTKLVGTSSTTVDSRTVALTVSQTAGLRDRQNITVTWTGAHPSANISLDPNSDSAVADEYPMVILQCRGIDSATAAAADRLDPTTCWSPYSGSRTQRNGAVALGGPNDVGNFPAWRLDRYATQSDRQQYANMPIPATPTCPVTRLVAEFALPFDAVDGTKYYGSGLDYGCGGPPPEAAAYSSGTSVTALPDNATFAASDLSGAGSASFNVRDAQTNASLGCSDTVACSIVAIPVMGISCDGGAGLPAADAASAPANAEAICERAGHYAAGSQQTPSDATPDYAVSGDLWWSASNWKNRISVPITLAAPDNTCDLISNAKPVDVYGSEMLVQASAKWSAKLCTGSNPTPLKHIQTGEPAARTLLSVGNVNAVFGSEPAQADVPLAQAPVALSGFAISYSIDDLTGAPYNNLKLTPRLLAKLMTESYPAVGGVQSGYTYSAAAGQPATNPLANNPVDITYDPEFIALNPGIGHLDGADGGRDALLSLASNSDVIHALTSYINADPEARAWLDGKPDPWGMQVNPNYKGIALPVVGWPLLDTYVLPTNPANGACEAISPQTPILPRVASPLSHLFDIAQSVQYADPGGQTACSVAQNPDGAFYSRYVRVGKQTRGRRFVIGLTSLGDADRYGLNTAALQTRVASGSGTPFTDASGRTFIAPTDDAIKLTATLAKFDSTTGVWPIPYSDLASSSDDANGYPGAMFVYADIPTDGLPSSDARAYQAILTFIAGPGQVPGVDPGDLPAGFVPLSASNGLGQFAQYTLDAAQAIGDQTGALPTAVTSPSAAGAGATISPQDGSTVEVSPAPPPSPRAPVRRSAPAPAVRNPSPAAVGASLANDAPAPGNADPIAGGSTTTAGRSPGSATATANPSPSVAPDLRSLGRTSGRPRSETKTIFYFLLVFLLLGPIGSPALLLASRHRRAR